MDIYIKNCIKKGFTNLWTLRRLAELGVSREQLLLVYESKIRVCVEQNCGLWMFSITNELSKEIERLQKISFYIILGKKANYSYSDNLAELGSISLEERREKLALKLAKNVLRHPEHRKMFKFSTKSNMRSGKRVIIPKTRTARYEKSTVPSLGKIINSKLAHKI